MDPSSELHRLQRELQTVRRARTSRLEELQRIDSAVAAHEEASLLECDAEIEREAALQIQQLRKAEEQSRPVPIGQTLAQLNELRLEDERRQLVISALEAALTPITQRIRAAAEQMQAVEAQVASLAGDARAAEHEDAAKASEYRARREAARARITEVSDAEAGKVLSVWDAETRQAAQQVRASYADARAGAKMGLEQELAQHADASRRAALRDATALAACAARVVDDSLLPELQRLRSVSATHQAALSHIAACCERLSRLLLAVRVGRDPGLEVAAAVEAFPLLSAALAAMESSPGLPFDTVVQQLQAANDEPDAGGSGRILDSAVQSLSGARGPLPPEQLLAALESLAFAAACGGLGGAAAAANSTPLGRG